MSAKANEFSPRPIGFTSRFQRIATVVDVLSTEAAKDKPRWTQSGGAFRKLTQLVADGELVLEDLSRGTDAYMAGIVGVPAAGATAVELDEDDKRVPPAHPRGHAEYWLENGTVKAKAEAKS